MQNLIIFICLIIGVYFSANFSNRMASSEKKIESKHTNFGNKLFNLSEI